MKGDFSRIRFNPAAQYTAVLKQQGRVDLDADANEQCFIDGRLDALTNVDVIGQYGGPAGNAGFQIGISANGITIGPGRYYVNGLLVENATTVSYDEQPFLHNPEYTAEELLAAVDTGGSAVQFVLEVWQRLVTGLDDNCLLEPALGQADTTVRLQTVWRVIGSIIPTTSIPPAETVDPANPVTLLAPCCQMLYGNSSSAHNGQLSAGTNRSGGECGCQPIAAAGYQGLENQLYRVEIHDATAGSVTFKWSRENGSVVSRITNINGNVLTVASLGPDANLGFQSGQWVELTDDTFAFGQPANQPGQLYLIEGVSQATLQVTLNDSVVGVDWTKNARMRRWDQSGTSATALGVAISATPVPLENGIEVAFAGGNYFTGDYWTIPARTATGQIAWPPCVDWPPPNSDGNASQPPGFTAVYEAPLGCIGLRPSGAYAHLAAQITEDKYIISDCRLLFSPLTVLNDAAAADAIHVSACSWANDDVVTVDTLLQNGLSVTFDTATSCPWGGGNFQVSMELPLSVDPLTAWEGRLPGIPAHGDYPAGTNIFGRSVLALDPPLGISVSGTQVTWIAPLGSNGLAAYESYYLYSAFNTSLNATAPLGFARIRVRLDGGGVYANGTSGNVYLDGTALGQTGTRVADASPCVSLTVPTGNQLKCADFESWFYLAPSIQIKSAVVQLLDSTGAVVGTNAVTITVNEFGLSTGLQTTATPASPAVAVQTVNLVVTFTYPPVAQTSLSFQTAYSGTTSIISLPSQQNSAAGVATVAIPIGVVGNPGLTASGAPNVDTVTITPSVAGLFFPVAFSGTAPTLVVTGSREAFRVPPFDGFKAAGFDSGAFQQALDTAKQVAASPAASPAADAAAVTAAQTAKPAQELEPKK